MAYFQTVKLWKQSKNKNSSYISNEAEYYSDEEIVSNRSHIINERISAHEND